MEFMIVERGGRGAPPDPPRGWYLTTISGVMAITKRGVGAEYLTDSLVCELVEEEKIHKPKSIKTIAAEKWFY